MSENKESDKGISEDALEKVAGGEGSHESEYYGCDSRCNYSTLPLGKKIYKTDSDGTKRIFCHGETVFGLDCQMCGCRGTPKCVDRYHIDIVDKK